MSSINAGTGIVYTYENSGALDLQGGGSTGISVNASAPYVKTVSATTAIVGAPGMIVYSTANTTLALYTNNWETIATYVPGKAIFGFGGSSAITNLVSITGVVATDTAGVGTARNNPAATSFGSTGQAIFGYGDNGSKLSMTNLVANTGVVSTDTTGVGTARSALAATTYGTGLAMFGYGQVAGSSSSSVTNLISNTGVVATDTTGVGTTRYVLAAAGYGGDKGIFGYGYQSFGVGPTSVTNKVSNTGVVATDTAGVGTIRLFLAATTYGTDKAIFGYGATDANATNRVSVTNLVSNTGVVASDTAGVGTARYLPAATGYGTTGQAMFGYGAAATPLSMTNLVSNTGVVATDTAGVGTARDSLAAAKI